MKAILAHAFALFSGCRAPLNKNSTLFYAESRGAFVQWTASRVTLLVTAATGGISGYLDMVAS